MQCHKNHELVLITPRISACECGPLGPARYLIGVKKEIERQVSIAGGWGALRDRIAEQRFKQAQAKKKKARPDY